MPAVVTLGGLIMGIGLIDDRCLDVLTVAGQITAASVLVTMGVAVVSHPVWLDRHHRADQVSDPADAGLRPSRWSTR